MGEAVQSEQRDDIIGTQDPSDLVNDWLSEDYLYIKPSRGDIRKATILAMRPDEILVDIGAKSTGVVQARDLDRLDEETKNSLVPGAEILVYVIKPDLNGEVLVSINMAQSMRDWQRAEEYLKDGNIFEAEVTGYNRGGLLVQFGRIQGFIPTSQVSSLRRRPQREEQETLLEPFAGQVLPLKVIEVDHRRRRLILSERQARREWEHAQREGFVNELQEGQIRKGIVSSFCDFGAFVSLGPMDGLVHISELSWERVQNPAEVLELGEEVEVYVLSVDRERERIALSLKRLQEDPWDGIASKYHEGQLIEGTITNIPKFGAFVSLESGIEGLIHISELDDGPVTDPNNIVVVGEKLLLRVLHVDSERHRIALSLRQVAAEDREKWYRPEDEEADDKDVSEQDSVENPGQDNA